MEHRWGERLKVDLPVKLTARPFTVRVGRLIDVSMSGALIRCGVDLRVLSSLQVAIYSARFRKPNSVIPAYVVRSHGGVLGIEWCEFGTQAVLELIRATARQRGPHRRDAQGSVATTADAGDGATVRKHGT